MIKAAIVGCGNIGRAALDALRVSGDMEIAGVVSGSLQKGALGEIAVAKTLEELEKPDVAILCAPSRAVPDLAAATLAKGIRTVDSFDIHTSVCDVRARLDRIAKEHGTAAVMSAGWDPGTDSMIRAVMQAMAPKGLTYTNFGPGMSMGHSVAVRGIDGVRDALSMTIPVGTGIHRRMVYIELEDGADFAAVEQAIKTDPYFVHDETHVIAVPSVDALRDTGHGVDLVRKGVSGVIPNQRFDFTMSINNPALTGQILVASARAVMRQAPGCYTMIELPPVDLLEGERDALVRQLV